MHPDATFDLIEITRLLWRRKWTLLLCGLACGGIAFGFSLSIPRRYSSESSLVVRSEALTAPENEAAFDSSVINEATVTTEQEVLTSEGLIRRVADNLNIKSEMVEQPSLTQRVTILLEEGAAQIGGTPLRQRLEVLLGNLLPTTPTTPEAAAEDRTHFVASALAVSTTKGSSVISLRALTREPQLSADIVNGVADLYMQDRLTEQSRTAHTIEEALRERQRQTRLQIAEGEDRLVKLLQEPGAVESSEIPGLMQGMSLLEAQLTQAQGDLARRKSDYDAAVRMRDHGGPAGAADSLSYMVSGDLRRQLSVLQQENARQSSIYLSEAPAHRAVQQEIAAVQAAIAAEGNRGIEQRRTEMAAAQATTDALQRQIDAMLQRRQSQSSSTIGVERQRQAVASLWKISDALDTRLIDLAARPINPNARILSVGIPATRASYPSKAMFTIAGFMLGSLGACAFTLVSNHMRRLRPLAIHLAHQLNAPLLGSLPGVAGTLGGQRKLLQSAVGERNRRDGLAATLRAVALEVEDTILQGKLGCLMVTSGKPGEGKTTVAIALGRSLAAISIRVILIDLDLRRPSIEKVLVSSRTGSLESLGQRIGSQIIGDVKRDRPSGLHILTPLPGSGDDPIGYLRSSALSDMVALARSSYDLILFDTPPVMSVPDALEVARLADGILLVTEVGRGIETDRAELSRRLARTRKPICGVIATKVAETDMQSGAYSGYTRLPATGRHLVSLAQAGKA